MSERLAVVGGGILGLAVARRILMVRPDCAVTVFEKEPEVGRHQTGHNSGVIHAGLYYTPGSLKATLCRRGVGLLEAFCEEQGIEVRHPGKVVVALDDGEAARLPDLEARALANGVPGVRLIGAQELREREPHVAGVRALLSPTTAIVDYALVARRLAEDIRARGGTVRCAAGISGVRNAGHGVVLDIAGATEYVDLAVLCAGLQSDLLARQAGDAPDPRIVPFRGEYHRLAPQREHLVRGLVYPVPAGLPFLGIHFTPRIHGGVDVGPNAVLALAREGYTRRTVRGRELASLAVSSELRGLARRYGRHAAAELLTSLSRRRFAARARRYVPELQVGDLLPAPAGVRAQAVDRRGGLIDDFVVRRIGRVVAVRNAPSPGATSALAIAEHIVAMLWQ